MVVYEQVARCLPLQLLCASVAEQLSSTPTWCSLPLACLHAAMQTRTAARAIILPS